MSEVFSYVFDKKYYCEIHCPDNSIEIHNICTICFNIIDVHDHMCKSCTLTMSETNVKTIKRKLKELEVKQYFEDKNINIDSYDKTIIGGCSGKRPDFIIYDDNIVIIELYNYYHNII